MDDSPSLYRRASVELLRAEATDERAVIIAERLRAGQDPWEFMDDLPTVDELVVLTLRAENIAASGGTRPTATRNFRVLRQIALTYPELTETVWRMLGNDTHRAWHAQFRAS